MNPTAPPLRLGVLLSGAGTSLENLLEHIEAGRVPARVEVVIASRTSAFGLERARDRRIPAEAVPRKQHPEIKEFNDRIHEILDRHALDLVLLLGFLSPFELRGRYQGRALNVHPALIPAFSGTGFYGRRVHEEVLASGVKLTGATVHFVDEEYDHGPIVLQEAVEVLDSDSPESLAERVQAAERRLVPAAVRLFAEGRLRIEGRRVRIVDADVGEHSP